MTVLRFLVEYTVPGTLGDSCDLTLQYVAGLEGSGSSIENRVTQNGYSLVPQRVEKTIAVTVVDALQLPGDCNQDGTLDLADAVCLLGKLFRGNPPASPCGDGSSTDPGNLALLDWQPDGTVDVSDAVSMLAFFFRALEPPPPGLLRSGDNGIRDHPGLSGQRHGLSVSELDRTRENGVIASSSAPCPGDVREGNPLLRAGLPTRSPCRP